MRPCENVNFCLFCECAYLQNEEEWKCSRDECVLNKVIVDWWEMSLRPRPLIVSNPPRDAYKIINAYFIDIEGEKVLRLIHSDIPQP